MDKSAKERLVDFIEQSFSDICKEPAGSLRYQYVIPGGPYAVDLWDWDSYWTLLAALEIAKRNDNPVFFEKIRPYACGTFFNFLDHQGEDGALPICIMPKLPDPFECLKSRDHNMAKPFIAQLGKLLVTYKLISAEETGKWLDKLRAFHQCYFDRYRDEKSGLAVWAKDWGIGVDDDPTAWGRPDRSCGSVFLNSFLFRDLLAAKDLAVAAGRSDLARLYQRESAELGKAIEKYCYDPREKAFFSVDVQCKQRLARKELWNLNENLTPFWHVLRLKVLLWNSILPFWNGLGTQAQFDDFVKENLVPDRLMSRFGIRSLSADEVMYRPEEWRGNPSNWLGPIWIIANYIAWETLKARNHQREADELAEAICTMLYRDLEACGKFHEYYSPETGEGVANPGFMSWNALAAVMALA